MVCKMKQAFKEDQAMQLERHEKGRAACKGLGIQLAYKKLEEDEAKVISHPIHTQDSVLCKKGSIQLRRMVSFEGFEQISWAL